jgi:hypothetical protein
VFYIALLASASHKVFSAEPDEHLRFSYLVVHMTIFALFSKLITLSQIAKPRYWNRILTFLLVSILAIVLLDIAYVAALNYL